MKMTTKQLDKLIEQRVQKILKENDSSVLKRSHNSKNPNMKLFAFLLTNRQFNDYKFDIEGTGIETKLNADQYEDNLKVLDAAKKINQKLSDLIQHYDAQYFEQIKHAINDAVMQLNKLG